MASIQELFKVDEYSTLEAKKLAIESQCTELQAFIRGLKQRKATVYSEIMKAKVVSFDVVIALSSLLLQANLYCRKTKSMLLLKQLFADELAEAIGAFYKADYIKAAEYFLFIKQVFDCFN